MPMFCGNKTGPNLYRSASQLVRGVCNKLLWVFTKYDVVGYGLSIGLVFLLKGIVLEALQFIQVVSELPFVRRQSIYLIFFLFFLHVNNISHCRIRRAAVRVCLSLFSHCLCSLSYLDGKTPSFSDDNILACAIVHFRLHSPNFRHGYVFTHKERGCTFSFFHTTMLHHA